MRKAAWIAVVGVMIASYSFGQDNKSQSKKEDVPRDVHISNTMKEKLNLTEAQYEKVLEVNKDMELTRKEAMAKMKASRKEHADQLKEILTEEQWKKWSEMKRPGRKGRPGRGPGMRGHDDDEG